MSILITFILLSTIAMSGFRRLRLMNIAFTLQSFSIALLCFYLGYTSNGKHYYILGILTIIIKSLIIPLIINRSIEKLKTLREMNLTINAFWSYVFTSFLVFLSLLFLESFIQNLIKTGVILILIGGFVLITRKKAINQMIGFLTIENGIVLLELSTVEMSLAIEFAMFLEVLILSLIMGIMIFHINRSFDSINTDYLSNLKE